jgi:hypothetical protein
MKAIMVALVLGVLAAPAAAQFGPPPPADPNAPTPRLANGKPDLTGSWVGVSGGLQGSGGDMFRRCTPFQSKNCMEWTNQSEDWVFMSSTRLDQRQPLYKPEYWDKIIALDQWTNKEDPVMTCKPLGLPRQGPPARIFHTDKDITMLYRAGVDGAGGYAEHRMVALDGRPHDPKRPNMYTYMGYTTGSWEGDTLVLDSTGFTDETWLGRGGWIHSDELRVIEKFTRKGNEILYEVTVEDPVYFLKPWVMPARTLRLSPTNAVIGERGSCTEGEHEEVSTQFRH